MIYLLKFRNPFLIKYIFKVIQSKVPPEIVAKEIAEKVSHNPREFSFWHIAKYAADNGRKDLAIKVKYFFMFGDGLF